MTVTKTHTAILFLTLLAGGCSLFDSEVSLRNRGFEAACEIAWSADHLSWTLRLGLLEGEEGDYLLTYVIDSDPLARLSTRGGAAVESGQAITLSTKGSQVLLLPSLAPGGGHTLEMELTREGVTRSFTLALPDTGGNSVGVRIDTDASLDYSRVVLTNRMGPSVTAYTVTFFLDGEILDGIKYLSTPFAGTIELDFARSESFTFELPYIVAGEHTLRVEVRSQQGSETSRLSFNEPQRRQTALSFSYNEYTGHLMLESPYNPLKTAFDVTVDATVWGSVTYRHPLFIGIADPATETFTASGESSVRVTPGLGAEPVDGGLLRRLMEEIHANERVTASNAIGNGNRETLHADITSIALLLTVHSAGDYAGRTAVSVSPQGPSGLMVRYTYPAKTWSHERGAVQTLYPSLTVNGLAPSAVRVL